MIAVAIWRITAGPAERKLPAAMARHEANEFETQGGTN